MLFLAHNHQGGDDETRRLLGLVVTLASTIRSEWQGFSLPLSRCLLGAIRACLGRRDASRSAMCPYRRVWGGGAVSSARACLAQLWCGGFLYIERKNYRRLAPSCGVVRSLLHRLPTGVQMTVAHIAWHYVMLYVGRWPASPTDGVLRGGPHLLVSDFRRLLTHAPALRGFSVLG